MKAKIKLYDEGLIIHNFPSYATPGSAAFDVRACWSNNEDMTNDDGEFLIPPHSNSVMIGLGFAMELPPGYVAKLYARSGLGTKHQIMPAQCVGIIDSDYRAEVMYAAINRSSRPYRIQPYERIGQIMIEHVEPVEFEIVDELSET